MARVLSLLKRLTKKNSLEGQGFAISASVAISGSAAVERGSAALGSVAGAGTSICGGGDAAGESLCLARSSHRDPKKKTTTKPSRAATSRNAGFNPGCLSVTPSETPGICGISALKRSAWGWSDINFILGLVKNSGNRIAERVACRPTGRHESRGV